MTTPLKLSPDDPKLTAYALGELEGEDLAAVEAALRDDAAAQAAVAEIRALGAQLTTALASEPIVDVQPAAGPALHQAAIIPSRDPRKLDGGPLGKRFHFPKVKFPQLYYLAGGLAAAAFAVLVAYHGSPGRWDRAEKKNYLEVALPSNAVSDGLKDKAEPAPVGEATVQVAMPIAPELKRDYLVVPAPAAVPASMPAPTLAGGLAAPIPTDMYKEMPIMPGQSAVAARAMDMGTGSGAAGMVANVRAQTLEKFSVASEGDQGIRALPAPKPAMGVQRTSFGGEAKVNEVMANAPSATELRLDLETRSLPMADAAKAKARPSAEAYAYQRDNDFLGAAQNPLSTFSIDVDTASYANVRRWLAEGQRPPADAVRIEELVNYFPYHYAAPAGGSEAGAAPFVASLEVADAPWAPAHRLVRIGLKGREVSTAARPAANLVFLLDVSGSMDEPNKLPLVKESLRLLLGKLRADDRVAIVVYAGASGLALPSTPVARSREILAALDELTPGGATNGAMGIQLAYDIAKANLVAGGINRVILCTDGDFNVGMTSDGELTRLIEEKAKSGVFLTVLGFGMGNYKDATLEQLADKGNGNYGYIDSRREAEKLLVEQVSGTLVTIAKDVKLQVEFNPALVASYRLIGYENRLLKQEDFNNDAVDAGEIGAGHTVTALYEIVPVGAEEKIAGAAPAVDELKYRVVEAGQNPKSRIQNPKSAELLTLKVRYKEPAGAVSRKLEFPLVDGGARFAAASTDFKFAAAVAEFGMILRDSPHKGTGTLADVLSWAQAGTDSDAGGYRGEFLGLVRQADALLR